ncbi:GspH/FimT family pseudopilin [Dyella sp. 2RAB6]|uniref:GspH/FimT family pseudopilin n=1 Tax=Dyella sp. 2RAB6 TaxID=3232992 RepID=UPI003F92167F
MPGLPPCRIPPSGVTLIEQVLVLAIAAVLACIGLPSLKRVLANSELRSAQTGLIAMLNHARGLAVQSGRVALACPSRDGERCSDEAGWEGSWLVGLRGERTGQLEGLPRVRRASPSGQLSIRSAQGRRSVQFQPDGSAGGSNITLLICHRGIDSRALSVKVSNAGRVRGDKATPAELRQCAGA